MNSEWAVSDADQAIEVARRELLVVDPSVLGAIGLSHSLSSAIADLIDNSLDAGASEISIRFLVQDARVVGLRIRDDGAGMTAVQLEKAFGLAVKRDYQDGSLGHFGLGLKSSSMSQAKVLTVYSNCGFEVPVGRRLRRHDAGGDGYVEVLSDRAAWDGHDRGFDGRLTPNGTVVEWLQLDTVSNAHDDTHRRAWLSTTMVQLRQQLGLTFHRLLTAGDIRIEIEQYDLALKRPGAPSTVEPINPFGFHQEGKAGYPKEISALTARGARMAATCHILPPNASGPAARLLGERRPRWQGLYLYRNDRLLQASGWHSLLSDASDTQLARVAIDLTDDLLADVALSPDKNGVVLRPGFIDALETALDEAGETSFRSYIEDARAAMQQANRRAAQVKPVTAIKSGLPDEVLESIETSLRHREDARPISLKWRQLEPGQVFWVDHAARTLWLNAGYRHRLSGSGMGLTGDASLLKATLFLLLEEYFAKDRLVQSALDQIEAWHAVLAAALATQFDISVMEADDPAEEEVEEETILPLYELPEQPAGDLAGDPNPVDIIQGAPLADLEAAGITDDPEGQEEDEPELFEDLWTEDADFTPQPGVAHVIVSADPMADYRRKSGRAPLLDAEEEVDLARRIEAGILAQEQIDSDQELSRIRTRELAGVVKDGTRAQSRMFAANMRLVISIAKRYTGLGLDFLDVIQEGNLGLLRAIEKFDYTLGNKFSTYATWWIRQGITRALADQGRTIRVPVHMVEQIQRLRKVKSDLEAMSDRAATFSEIAVAAGATSASEVQTILHYDLTPLSLDDVVVSGYEGGEPVWTALGELIEDSEALSPEEAVAFTMLQKQLESLLDSLTEREAGLIRMRFGLGDGQPKTLDQIGDTFGVTRERIRQIEVKTMVKLRHPSLSDSLRDYFDDGMSWFTDELAARRDDYLLKRRLSDEPEVPLEEGMIEELLPRVSPGTVVMPATVIWAKLGKYPERDDDNETESSERPEELAEPAEELSDQDYATLEDDDPSSPDEVSDAEPASSTEPTRWWQLQPVSELPALEDTDSAILEALHSGATIGEIAGTVGRDKREIALRLTMLLFRATGELDAADEAPRHGDPLEHDERDRMISEYRHDIAVERIAAKFGRTILAVAWQLLDSPKRPVEVPKRLRKAAKKIRA